jgi:hypothetical protein
MWISREEFERLFERVDEGNKKYFKAVRECNNAERELEKSKRELEKSKWEFERQLREAEKKLSAYRAGVALECKCPCCGEHHVCPQPTVSLWSIAKSSGVRYYLKYPTGTRFYNCETCGTSFRAHFKNKKVKITIDHEGTKPKKEGSTK